MLLLNTILVKAPVDDTIQYYLPSYITNLFYAWVNQGYQCKLCMLMQYY